MPGGYSDALTAVGWHGTLHCTAGLACQGKSLTPAVACDRKHMAEGCVERLVAERMPSGAVLPAGILYHDMYASDLVGTHVEMRSLEVRYTCLLSHLLSSQ